MKNQSEEYKDYQAELERLNNPEREEEPEEIKPLQTMNRFDSFFDRLENDYPLHRMAICIFLATLSSCLIGYLLFTHWSFENIWIEILTVLGVLSFTQALVTSLLYRLFFRKRLPFLKSYVYIFFFWMSLLLG